MFLCGALPIKLPDCTNFTSHNLRCSSAAQHACFSTLTSRIGRHVSVRYRATPLRRCDWRRRRSVQKRDRSRFLIVGCITNSLLASGFTRYGSIIIITALSCIPSTNDCSEPAVRCIPAKFWFGELYQCHLRSRVSYLTFHFWSTLKSATPTLTRTTSPLYRHAHMSFIRG